VTRSGKVVVIALWAVAVIEAIAIGAWYGVIAGYGDRLTRASMDAAGIVLMIGAVSVGIERLIEYLWAVAGLAVGSFWPVSAAGAFLADLTDDVDRTVAPHIEQAQAILQGLKDAQAIGDSVVTDVTSRLTAATGRLDELKGSVKHSQGAVTYVAAAADVANNVSVELQALVDAAHAAAGSPEARLALASSIVKAQASLQARTANRTASRATSSTRSWPRARPPGWWRGSPPCPRTRPSRIAPCATTSTRTRSRGSATPARRSRPASRASPTSSRASRTTRVAES
jgi:hypothetical protein